MTDGVGDIEYFYTAQLDAPYYLVRDYACTVGYGTGWTEQITAITNRATYAADETPTGGTDYFVRIREGESNIEWVQLVGKLFVTNAATGTVVEKDLLIPGSRTESPRMTLVGDHSWRYHYQIPTNEIGGRLEFHLVTKEYYTNATDATEWFVRTNWLYTIEDTVTDIPFTATLHDGFDGTPTNEISVILDNAATHLKIEYNDEQRAFSLSHAAYQDFNQWTDAKDAFRGNVMETNGNAVVSNSGVSGDKGRFDAAFDNTWELCPETRDGLWTESFTPPSQTNTVQVDYPLDTWYSVLGTPNGWTGHNGRFVLGERANNVSIPLTSLDRALALDGLGEGALAIENFTAGELPRGLDTVEFTARIAQPIQFEDFATYLYGMSSTNYAISAKVTMSQEYESTDRTHKPTDMSPIHPSISLVGYHRGVQGCYEFRITRKTDVALELALYKWARSGSTTKPTLLASKSYNTNLLVPSTQAEANGSYWTSAYFLVYTLAGGGVKLEGHLAPKRTNRGVYTDANSSDTAALKDSVISVTDPNPGILARGGTYGVGSTDCCAGFGQIGIHTVSRAPSDTTDAIVNFPSTYEGTARLGDDWDYYESRWQVDQKSGYASNGGLLAVIPSNQVIEVWLADAEKSGSGWTYSGYSTTVNSFSTNKFSVSPHMPGTWKVRLQTGQEEDAGVVVDDVSVTPWEGVETWGRDGTAYDEESITNWVYTKAWITASADVKYKGKPYVIPRENIKPVGTNGYVFVFNEPGNYEFTPSTDMEIDRALVVGGGGSGGATMGGGGGGGGVVEVAWTNKPVRVPKGTRVFITVGAGGAAPVPVYSSGNANSTSQPAGKNGGDSKIEDLPNVTIPIAKGGGGGSGWSVAALAGGSGGGGANARAGGNGTSGQGHNGGKAITGSSSSYGLGGGGGGGGGVGQDGVATNSIDFVGGKGGDGWASDITGKLCYYGGGGGGGVGWKSTAVGGAGGLCGPADKEMTAGHGASYHQETTTLTDGLDGYGGGGGGGTYYDNGKDNVTKGAGARGGCGTVILRVRTSSVLCDLQPSRGTAGYPMGLRTPFIDEGMSLFTYSYANADSNCVLLVQISTNMLPNQAGSYVPELTESVVTNGGNRVWTTIARHDFSTMTTNDLAKGTKTAFISLRQHTISSNTTGQDVYTNVCGVIRVIVDPAIVARVANIPSTNIVERKAFENYGRITLTKAYCYNEPPLDMRSWFGWNVYTDGWDGEGNAGRFAYLTDWPDGLSIALNFSPKKVDNDVTSPATLGIGLAEPEKELEYAGQNPFIQSAALTNGIGTVSFRARLFDTNAPRAVITLYGSEDPAADQPMTEAMSWHILTNFMVTSPTYQAFEWNFPGVESHYQAIRLEAAGARWGRYPSVQAKPWEWGDLPNPKYSNNEPVNRVFIDEVSVSELIVPRLKFLDVRPFRTNLGTEKICVITNIMSVEQQPLANESWGVQCRIEPQQMADELDLGSIRVWLDVYRGRNKWGYKQWKDEPETVEFNGRTIRQRFSSQLQQVSTSNLIFRSYYELPDSIIPPEEEANTVYQYVVRATYRDKSGKDGEYTNVLSSVDWDMPEWYRGSNVGAGNESGDPDQFSAFTILDAISPRRAWINELNLCDAMPSDGLYQFIELAVPSGANIEGWKLLFLSTEGEQLAPLVTLGVDEGVQGLKSKTGVYDYNKYTFVSICSPKAKENVRNDGYWKSRWATSDNTNSVKDGVFSPSRTYGIQLLRPSGIIEHEIVMQGTNRYANISGMGYSGTNLTAQLQRKYPDSGWFYAGEDYPYDNTSLGVMANHGGDASDWENVIRCTPGERNRRKNGTYQTIPSDYFIEPLGGIICIESRLLQPQYSKQFFGGNDMGANTKIAVTADITTNIVFMVTNWYQLGVCTIDGKEAPAMRGKTGTYTLTLGPITNTVKLVIDVEPDDKLKTDWGLTADNSYSHAVLAWLEDNYMDYKPSDLSQAIYRDLSGLSRIPLTLTEMYWLNIPPVHQAPIYGGSNIWFKAGMGALVSGDEPDVEPYVYVRPDGTILSNVFLTVTMMITNTSPLATRKAWPPDRLNGHEYVNGGSSVWDDHATAWTSVVFSVMGALQKPGYTSSFLPLQQYVFKPNSFGAPDSAHPFQTRIEVMDPYTEGTMGNGYGWPQYRGVFPIFYRWVIKGSPDMSPVPLELKGTKP